MIVLFFQSCILYKKTNIDIIIEDDNNLGIPLADIKITNNNTSLQFSTDFEGKSTLIGLKKGSYEIEVSAIGFYPIKVNITDIDKSIKQMKFKMNPFLNKNDTIEIKWSGGKGLMIDEKGNLKTIQLE